jgi:hypothetical protein
MYRCNGEPGVVEAYGSAKVIHVQAANSGG